MDFVFFRFPHGLKSMSLGTASKKLALERPQKKDSFGTAQKNDAPSFQFIEPFPDGLKKDLLWNGFKKLALEQAR